MVRILEWKQRWKHLVKKVEAKNASTFFIYLKQYRNKIIIYCISMGFIYRLKSNINSAVLIGSSRQDPTQDVLARLIEKAPPNQKTLHSKIINSKSFSLEILERDVGDK